MKHFQKRILPAALLIFACSLLLPACNRHEDSGKKIAFPTVTLGPLYDTPIEVGEFSLEEHMEYFELCPSDVIFGEVATPEEAVLCAYEMWSDISTSPAFNVRRPFLVSYDPVSDCWLVDGSMVIYPNGTMLLGLEPIAIIHKSTGKVLSVWIGK